MKLKASKCVFFEDKIKYLGHIVSSRGIQTDPDKLVAVAKWPTPKTVKQLRNCLGLASYYRRFVNNFATIASPLHSLTGEKISKKKTKNKSIQSSWITVHQQSFELLKEKLISAPILAYQDSENSFVLEIDVSDKGLGAVLSQEQGEVRRVVAYASRGLRKPERNMSNYSSKKLELLALKWAVTEKFRDYLSFAPCKILTDNNPLTYLLTKSKLSAVEQKWASELANYDVTLEYKPGRLNASADALSRQHERQWDVSEEEVQDMCHSVLEGTALPISLQAVALEDIMESGIENTESRVPITTVLPKMSRQNMIQLQSQDPHILTVMGYMDKGLKLVYKAIKHEPTEVKLLIKQWYKLKKINGVLYRVIIDPDQGEVKQMILPQSCKEKVLEHLHDKHGHPGFDRTVALIKARWFWPFLRKDIQEWINHCSRCVISKDVPVKAPLGTIRASKPLDFTLMDKSSSGLENILIITDVFSK